MKTVLYVTNIEVPYKVKFFNQLSTKCDLTVLYERKESSNRDATWVNSIFKNYKIKCFDGDKIGNEFSFSISAIKCMLQKYDVVILSCVNSPVQIMASLVLRLLKKKFYFSLDGELFVGKSKIKSTLKKFFVKGATMYLSAGEVSSDNLKMIVGDKPIIPYYFSSLTQAEILHNISSEELQERDDFILVIGQYFDYKGLDIAIQAARMDSSIKYKFVGMGKRTDMFINEQHVRELKNVTVIPFLQKEELQNEYKKAKAVVLPSRQECWGLVVNEAASFGTPIISTRGSGAAVEFLEEQYSQYLAISGDVKSLYNAIVKLIESDNSEYEKFLKNKSLDYSIEHMVDKHIEAFEKDKL